MRFTQLCKRQYMPADEYSGLMYKLGRITTVIIALIHTQDDPLHMAPFPFSTTQNFLNKLKISAIEESLFTT
jgi:hypothetical protein